MQTQHEETDVIDESATEPEAMPSAEAIDTGEPVFAADDGASEPEATEDAAESEAVRGAEAAVEETGEPDYFAGLSEENAARQRGKGIKFAVACILLTSVCSGAYLTVPAFKNAADGLFFKAAGGDASADAGDSILDPYKKALKKIDGYGDRVDEATRALGVDPTKKMTKEQLARHDAQVKNIFGDAGNTTEERDKRIQEKFGHIGSITDAEIQAAPETAAAAAAAGK